MSGDRGGPGDGAGPPTWDRVGEAFHALLALAETARAARLAELGASDPRLAAELRSLLAAHDAAGDYLEAPPVLAAPAAAPGERIGPWRVVGEIGRGGMGVVYRAERDEGGFRQQVAIKLVEPALRSAGMLSRFRAERRILARLEHPHIARLVDGGTAPDGSPYLAMEYVEGRPLLEWCDAHRLGIDARIALFLTVCDAVQFAHQQLVVHRDLKMDNVFVTADGSPRLLDFGIARLIVPEGEDGDDTVTVPLLRRMTPDYASPEQVRGDPVGVAGDVYSLGVVLYELLTGSRPLRFRTRTPEEILRVVTQVEPARPSAAVSGTLTAASGDSARGARRRLAGDLDDIVLKALEKDPARRYGSVAELAGDLRRHLDGRPVLARGPSAAYRASRYVRRHRGAVIAASLVALALVAGLVTTSWQAGVARRERDRADRRFRDVRELAHAVVFDLHDAIADLPGSTPARESLVRHALRYLDELGRESGNDPALQRELAAAYARIGDVQGRPMFANLGQSAAALESYRKAIVLFDAAGRAWPESTGVARDRIVVAMRMGDVLRVSGRLQEAREVAEDAKRRIVERIARDPETIAYRQDMGVVCDRLFNLHLEAGDTAAAVRELDDAGAAMSPAYARAPNDPALRRARLVGELKLGQLYTAWGRHDSAFACFRRARPLAEEAVARQPDNAAALRDLTIYQGLLAFALAGSGQLDSALAVYDQSMRICRRMAARDPDNALLQEDLAAGEFEIGTMLRDGGRTAGAARHFGEAARQLTVLCAADTGNAERRLNLARALRDAGEAGAVVAARAAARAEAAAWRTRARDWLGRALAEFRALERTGALPGDEREAAARITARLATLGGGAARPQSPPAAGPASSR